MQSKTHKIINLLSLSQVWIGGILIIAAMLITIVDIIARWTLKVGFIGLVDVTQFAVVGFAYLAMPYAFLSKSHVCVEFYDTTSRPRLEAMLYILGAILSILVLAILLYYGWIQMSRTLRYGDVSNNLEIPMVSFWVMILVGAACSIIVCVIQLLQNIKQIITGYTH